MGCEVPPVGGAVGGVGVTPRARALLLVLAGLVALLAAVVLTWGWVAGLWASGAVLVAVGLLSDVDRAAARRRR